MRHLANRKICFGKSSQLAACIATSSTQVFKFETCSRIRLHVSASPSSKNETFSRIFFELRHLADRKIYFGESNKLARCTGTYPTSKF